MSRRKSRPEAAGPGLRLAGLGLSPASPVSGKGLLSIAASLEARTTHAIAGAVLKAARKNRLPLYEVQNFRAFPALGVGGLVAVPGRATPLPVLLGSRAFMAESRLEISEVFLREAGRWEESGGIPVFCGWEGQVRGLLKLRRR